MFARPVSFVCVETDRTSEFGRIDSEICRSQRHMNLEKSTRALLDEAAGPRGLMLDASRHKLDSGGTWFDFGRPATRQHHGLQAGVLLANICMAGLGRTAIENDRVGDLEWPHVTTRTDAPLAACLLSQYAGWQLSVDDFFGMGSGPMRVAAATEEIVREFDAHAAAAEVFGVLESGQPPTESLFRLIADQCGVSPAAVTLFVAPTASLAGSVQIAARCLETAMHKLHELKFDVRRIVSGFGTTPLSPVAKNDLHGIGRTNDSILYGGRVHVFVTGSDADIEEIGPRVPASDSDCYGKPFLEIFEDAGRDFYKIDPHLFSPAEITFQNLETGAVQTFGKVNADILRTSFGL